MPKPNPQTWLGAPSARHAPLQTCTSILPPSWDTLLPWQSQALQSHLLSPGQLDSSPRDLLPLGTNNVCIDLLALPTGGVTGKQSPGLFWALLYQFLEKGPHEAGAL